MEVWIALPEECRPLFQINPRNCSSSLISLMIFINSKIKLLLLYCTCSEGVILFLLCVKPTAWCVLRKLFFCFLQLNRTVHALCDISFPPQLPVGDAGQAGSRALAHWHTSNVLLVSEFVTMKSVFYPMVQSHFWSDNSHRHLKGPASSTDLPAQML